VSGPASGDAVHGRRVRALRAAVAVCEGLATSCRPLDIVPCSDLGRMSASGRSATLRRRAQVDPMRPLALAESRHESSPESGRYADRNIRLS
jgi:hypothetical protein